jgi:hypothetical protein
MSEKGLLSQIDVVELARDIYKARAEKAEADRAELLEALKQGVELFKYHEPDCFPSSGHCTEKCKQNKKTIISWRDLIARLTKV